MTTLAVAVAALSTMEVVHAQVDAGTVLGTVRDEASQGAAGAAVKLTDEGTSFQRSTSTSEDGTYIFTPVKVGTYTLTVEREGFAPAVHKGIVVSVQQRVIVDVQLHGAQASGAVEAAASAAPVQRQDAPLGQVIGAKEISDLPLSSRNLHFLARLVPGVTFGPPDALGLNASGSFRRCSVPGTR